MFDNKSLLLICDRRLLIFLSEYSNNSAMLDKLLDSPSSCSKSSLLASFFSSPFNESILPLWLSSLNARFLWLPYDLLLLKENSNKVQLQVLNNITWNTFYKRSNRPDSVVLVLINIIIVQSIIVMVYWIRDNFRIVHAQFAPLQFVLQISFGKKIKFDILITIQ